MDKLQFESALTEFNVLLMENSNVKVLHNYIRKCSISSFIFQKVQLPSTEKISDRTIEFTVHFDTFYTVPILSYRLNYSLDAVAPYCAMDIHPILQSPFYFLHPCETRDTMATIPVDGPVDYLIKWIGISFSLVLPELELRIPTN